MGQWSNLTANFLSRSCRLIILVLAISTAVPFTFGINTAQAQTVPTAVWQDLSRVPTIGEQTTLIIEFNARVLGPAGTIKGLTISDFSFTGSKTPSLGVNNRRAIIRLIPEEAQFTATLNANSVTLNGVAGPANAVTFAYTPPPTIALAGPDTGASDRDRITGQRGILITLASNFDRDRGDTWGISVDGGVDGYTRTRVDNANAAPNLRFGLGDGVYTDNQVRVRNTVNGITSDFAGLAAFTFDSTRPIINLNGGDITLTAGQTYTEQASVSDVLDTSVRLRVGGDTLDTNTAGTYDLTYDATDTAGNAAVQLTRTVTVTEPVTLSALTVSPGTLSPDFDPAISAYNVIVGAGVSSISFTPTFRAGTVVIEVAGVFGGMISSGSTSSRVFAGTRATYNIAVTHGGVSTTYSVTATRNTAPVADAGDDDTAATNAPVALDGSGSSDPNSHVGDTLSYAWEHTLTNSATPATAITLPDATAESPTFTPTAAGAYTFTLTVTDSVGASHTDTVVITVTEPPVTLSTDSTLSALEVSAGSLNPTFASGTDAYAVSVANGVTSIRITPTVTDTTGATVTVGKSGATPVAVAGGEASEEIALALRENPINIIVTAEDTSTQTYIVTVTRTANTAPEITGNATLDYAEGRTDSVATYTATDTENNAITWSLSGTDAGSLTIGATSGILTFNTTPDFETKSTYSITITATDDGTPPMTDTQAVTVTVTNVEEGVGMVTISGTAQVGMVLTAGTVTGDPDVVASVDSHEWQSAPDGTTTYAAYNPAATGSTYTPGVDDVGRTIRVVATYTDGEGGGKKVASAATAAVKAAASTDATLSGLVVTGNNNVVYDLNEAITSTRTDYTANVPNGVRSVRLTLTSTHANAVVRIGSTVITRGGDTASITLPAGGNQGRAIDVTAEAGGAARRYNLSIIRAANTAPTITAGNEAIMVDENTREVATYAATDDEGNTIAWSHGGTDASLFTIDATSGVLTFNAPLPNYEVPTDAGNDRVYDITVTATDNGTPNEEHTLDVVVTVTDVEETGTIGRITGTAQVGVELTAGKVTDPDGAVTGITYQWQSSPSSSNTYTTISGAGTDATYTPVDGDEGNTIQVIATYTDGFGSDTAISAATDAVRAAAVVTPIAPPAVYTSSDAPHATDGDKVVITFTSSHTGDFTIEFDGGRTIDFSIDDAATPYIHTETVGYDYTGNVRIFLGLGEVAMLPVTTGSEPNAPSVTVVRNPNNSIEVSWDNIPGVDFTIYAVTTGANDVEIIDLVTSPHTIATTDPLFDTVNNADGIGVRGFAEGNPVGDHSAPITSDEVPDEAPAVTDTTPPTVTLGTITEGVIGTAQDYDITFSEAVTGLAVGDFSVSNTIVPSGDLVVNSVTDSGDHTTYTISITPRATAFTLTLDANSVTDLAATPNMGPATAASASGSATAAPAPTNTAPVVSGNAAPNYAENASGAETYAATDAESNAIAWSVTGTDASFFAIDADGALTFSTSPDFEDAHGATYSITITATETNGDPSDLTGELAVTVTVTNVDEPGAIGDITGTAQVGVELTAGSVTDPDGAVTGVTYQWQSSPSDSGDYTNISGADQGTYTLVKGDEGRTIQVIATYTDPQGGNKKATTAPTTAVKAAGVTPPPPAPTDNTAPVLTYDRFTHTGGVVDGVITRLNAGDRLTVFVNSDEPLADSSLMDAAIFILDDAKRPAQALLRAGVTNQYRATYTIKAADHGKGLQCSVSGVMDAAGNRAADFTSPSLLVSIDTEPPVITLIGASPALVAHGGDYTDRSVNGVNTGAGETLATVITGPDAMTVTAVDTAAGDYTYTYTATDRAGNVSTPVTRTVTVSAANQPPVANAGGDQAVDTGASVTLNGTASSDPDGDDAALRYAWSQTDNDAPRVSLSGADTATPGFTAPSLLSADAELVFRLTVSDGAVSATDTVTITVTRPRDTVAPVITLLGDSPLEVNQGATYTDPGATASDDTDGDLSAGIIVGGDTVDTDTIGAYSVTYDVSDAAGNAAATVTRIVRVVVARDLAALNEAILPEVARDIADRNVSAIARRIEQARLPSRTGSSASLGGASSLAEIAKSQGSTVADGQFDLKRLLNNSNFVLPLNATGAGAADSTQLTLWGAGDYRDLQGADGVRWSGDLFSLQLGLDAHLNERTILGVSVSKSQVELNYTNPGPAAGGNYDLDMTSVHPYLGWTAGGLDFWATLGYGEGELEISADGAQTDIASSDLSMQTLGLGANGVLMETGTTTLLLKTEILSTELEVDASEEITAITQQAHRVRMTLEAIRGHSLDSGAQLETSLEAGLRYDDGDGETGAGAELGGGLRYASDSGGLVIEGKARALVGGKGDTEEWGLSGLIKLNPAANGRGLSFSLTPGYGVTASGVERLWQQGLDDGLGAQGGTDGNNYTPNLDLRLDYGMDVSAMPGLVTPYTEFSFGATGDTYRLGLQWQRSKWFDLKLVTEREEGQITVEHRIYIEGEIVF